MDYKLVITEQAEKLLDDLLAYLLVHLNNKQAATHLLNGIESIYLRLEENPFQFPLSSDPLLANKGVHSAIIPEMHYIMLFNIVAHTVNIAGVFHQLENHSDRF